ncbi:hypothetical protein ACFQ9Z_30415 [Streptomyces sp. NPDC056580]|uniref:hypothetical protein n=1 Tax=Streptomyces sp. NPDC056580 TaxID=3345872 RepID=UPI0036A98096
MEQVSEVEIPLDRDVFLRTSVRELATSLESVIGLEEATFRCRALVTGPRRSRRLTDPNWPSRSEGPVDTGPSRLSSGDRI